MLVTPGDIWDSRWQTTSTSSGTPISVQQGLQMAASKNWARVHLTFGPIPIDAADKCADAISAHVSTVCLHGCGCCFRVTVRRDVCTCRAMEEYPVHEAAHLHVTVQFEDGEYAIGAPIAIGTTCPDEFWMAGSRCDVACKICELGLE